MTSTGKKTTKGSRVTPKGGKNAERAASTGGDRVRDAKTGHAKAGHAKADHAAAGDAKAGIESKRYTPPGVKSSHLPPSPMWVPVLMFVLLGVGSLVIIINYMGVLPGGTKQMYTFGGLGLILGGIITATQYR